MSAHSARPPREGLLESRPSEATLAPFVSAFVHRDEAVDGAVVRVLPELRASIQIQTASPYWLRERDSSAMWRRTPRVALWGPRFEWGYGFAADRIKAYAIALTASGLRTIAGTRTALLLNRVCGLSSINQTLAVRLDPLPDEPFDAWALRSTGALREFFAAAAPPLFNLAAALGILATSEGGAVARAAKESGLSERQFRRVFEGIYGVAPKRYQRALRVDRMIRRLHPAPWETDAHEGEGPFADQAHAIREFQELTGMTPADYAAAMRSGGKTLRSVAVEGIAPPNDGGDGAAQY